MLALIDTGADVNVMRENVHNKIGAPKLSNVNIQAQRYWRQYNRYNRLIRNNSRN